MKVDFRLQVAVFTHKLSKDADKHFAELDGPQAQYWDQRS